MPTSNSQNTTQNATNTQNQLQPIIYGVLPEQSGDEIDLRELISRLASQWKLILGVTLGGTALAVLLALMLPKIYQPSVTVSVPLAGNVASVAATNTLLGKGGDGLPSTPQAVFTNYFNLLRSERVLQEYVQEKKYLEKLYPDDKDPESVLLADLTSGFNIKIEEPTPEKKRGYIANPTRVRVSLDVKDEAIGSDLLNGYSSYANQRLIANLQNDVRESIKNKIETLTSQVASQREQYKQDRILTIKKMEQDNAKKIAQLKAQISAYLRKAKANRVTRIANAKEALAMAKSLNITYPSTLESLAQRGQKGQGTSTAITVVDKQSSSLYLQGTKYLTTLIKTLEKRKSDEQYLAEINNLREKIHLIENDQALAALKKRKSDDPWIKNLPEKLAGIDALKTLNPDFTSLTAFSMDESAMVTNKAIKPNRKLIAVIGLVLSLIIATFAAMLVASWKRK